jgi:hypothetical protein
LPPALGSNRLGESVAAVASVSLGRFAVAVDNWLAVLEWIEPAR